MAEMTQISSELDRNIRRLLIGAAVALIVSVLVAGLAVGQMGGLSVGIVGCGWSLAVFFPASIVGLLFGIPRRRSEAQMPKDPNAGLQLNPNLEQISDWATKIITGVTLINARNIPSYIYKAGTYIGFSLSKDGGSQATSSGSLIVVLFSGLGFLAGYVFASTYLTQVLDQTRRGLDEVTKAAMAYAESELEKATQPRNESPPYPDSMGGTADKGARALAASVIGPDTSAESLELIGMARMNTGQFEGARQAFEEAIRRIPSRLRSYRGLATSLYRMGKYSEAVNILERGLSFLHTETENQQYKYYDQLIYCCLYLDPPESFKKAIRYADESISRFQFSYFGPILLNKACALGQEAEYKGPDADISTEAKQARGALDKLIAENPGWRKRIAELMDPESEDHDLAVFRSRPEFRNLLNTDLK